VILVIVIFMLMGVDYGESHYIGPVRVDQPNSQGWTNGMPHSKSQLGYRREY